MDRLKNKKVYVGKYSIEIQEKAFALGFKWLNPAREKVSNLKVPFLFFNEDGSITWTSDVEYFNKHEFEEVTAEYIVSFKVKKKPKWKDFGKVDGYYVSDNAMIREYCSNPLDTNMNVFPTKKEAEACIALSQLCQWRDKYNEGWEPDWTDNSEKKYIIQYFNEVLYLDCVYKSRTVLAFKNVAIRRKFLEDFRELIEQAKPLL